MQFHSICFVYQTGCIKNILSCRQFWSTRQKNFKNLGLESYVQDWINELNFSKIRISYKAGILKLSFSTSSSEIQGLSLTVPYLCFSSLPCSAVIPLLQQVICESSTGAKRPYKQGIRSLKLQNNFYLLEVKYPKA